MTNNTTMPAQRMYRGTHLETISSCPGHIYPFTHIAWRIQPLTPTPQRMIDSILQALRISRGIAGTKLVVKAPGSLTGTDQGALTHDQSIPISHAVVHSILPVISTSRRSRADPFAPGTSDCCACFKDFRSNRRKSIFLFWVHMPKQSLFTLQATLNSARRGMTHVWMSWRRAVPLPPPLVCLTETGRPERRSQRGTRGQLALQSRSCRS
jgi:hypothetical protein